MVMHDESEINIKAWRSTKNMLDILCSPGHKKWCVFLLMFGIVGAILPEYVYQDPVLGEWGGSVEIAYSIISSASLAIAGPKLYMVAPNFWPNRMWKKAVCKGGRWVPNHWLESADLLEYWRRMYECSNRLRRFGIRS